MFRAFWWRHAYCTFFLTGCFYIAPVEVAEVNVPPEIIVPSGDLTQEFVVELIDRSADNPVQVIAADPDGGTLTAFWQFNGPPGVGMERRAEEGEFTVFVLDLPRLEELDGLPVTVTIVDDPGFDTVEVRFRLEVVE